MMSKLWSASVPIFLMVSILHTQCQKTDKKILERIDRAARIMLVRNCNWEAQHFVSLQKSVNITMGQITDHDLTWVFELFWNNYMYTGFIESFILTFAPGTYYVLLQLPYWKLTFKFIQRDIYKTKCHNPLFLIWNIFVMVTSLDYNMQLLVYIPDVTRFTDAFLFAIKSVVFNRFLQETY